MNEILGAKKKGGSLKSLPHLSCNALLLWAPPFPSSILHHHPSLFSCSFILFEFITFSSTLFLCYSVPFFKPANIFVSSFPLLWVSSTKGSLSHFYTSFQTKIKWTILNVLEWVPQYFHWEEWLFLSSQALRSLGEGRWWQWSLQGSAPHLHRGVSQSVESVSLVLLRQL